MLYSNQKMVAIYLDTPLQKHWSSVQCGGYFPTPFQVTLRKYSTAGAIRENNILHDDHVNIIVFRLVDCLVDEDDLYRPVVTS